MRTTTLVGEAEREKRKRMEKGRKVKDEETRRRLKEKIMKVI
jgi:hypothetical protein